MFLFELVDGYCVWIDEEQVDVDVVDCVVEYEEGVVGGLGEQQLFDDGGGDVDEDDLFDVLLVVDYVGEWEYEVVDECCDGFEEVCLCGIE